MRKLLRRLGIILLGLIVLIVVVGAVAYIIGDGKLNKVYTIPAQSISIPTDQVSILEGKRLATVWGCTDCHTENLSGRLLADNPMIGTIYTANLTPGGELAKWSDSDVATAIRHGVSPDGKALIGMPSNDYFAMNDADVSKIIAFVRSVPAVDNKTPRPTITTSGKILIGLGLLPPQGLAAAYIDHNAAISRPTANVSAAYGKYLATTCTGCHNAAFSGGPIPFAAPDMPAAANLTPGGDLAKWSDSDFIKFFHTGITPEGKQIDSKHMPWKSLGQMTEDELKALFLYLKSLPAKETGKQ
jgi:mono/diheme cytochrome c family protein